jgi:hypothetical protein
VAELPQFLTYEQNRDALETYELTARRTFFGAIVLLAVVAGANVFGQRPANTVARRTDQLHQEVTLLDFAGCRST